MLMTCKSKIENKCENEWKKQYEYVCSWAGCTLTLNIGMQWKAYNAYDNNHL